MIVANQQANIKNVNGAIADTLANIPPAQSTFYLFYATDTQEIYYDNGAWILLGTGGGGTNIYNADGTLTANRTVNGANRILNFESLSILRTKNSSGETKGLRLDFNNEIYIFGNLDNPRSVFLGVYGFSELIKTTYNTNDIGLTLDFANNEFLFGAQYNNGGNIYIQGGTVQSQGNGINAGFIFNDAYITLGDYSNTTNGTQLTIDDNNQIIKTQSVGNDIGLKLDFANGYSLLTSTSNVASVAVDGNFAAIGDWLAGGNITILLVDDANSILQTKYQNNDIGIKLDFANTLYQFGQLTGGNAVKITFDDTNDRIFTTGISNQVSGLDIYPNLQQFYFGVNSTNNLTHLFINDVAEVGYFANAGFVQGLNLDFANSTYKFGQINGGNQTRLEIFDPTGVIETLKPGGVDGLQLNLINSVYKFGNLTGTNNTYLQIDDLAAFPVQLNGTNVLSGTSGGNSGQHIKIKVNGVDYKIKLENP